MKIAIIATGGTISGYSSNSLDMKDYKYGTFSISEIIDGIPELKQYADLDVLQLENFSSCEITSSHWILLKNSVESYLNEKNYDGVVITHGTNTLEETAYFLHLTIHSEKLVVLVGSQRPYSALGSDAHINLVNAIRVAASLESRNKGVLVVLNDEINGAREVTKTNTYRLETFQSGQLGLLGYVDVDGTVQYYRMPTRKHTVNSCFSTINLNQLSDAAIVYSYAGANGDIINHITNSKRYKGIVIAGTGAGKFSKSEEKALVEATKEGLTVVRSSRVGNGRVVALYDYENYHFIAADNLLPQKARVLLMLSLAITEDVQEIQRLFNEY